MKFAGQVIKGEGQATKLFGLPTANVELAEPTGLEPGVYAARASLGGRQYQAVAYVSPKFPNRIEVHVLNFTGDLYGQTLEVEVLEKTSPHVDWEGEDQMRAKVLEDLKRVKEYFG